MVSADPIGPEKSFVIIRDCDPLHTIWVNGEVSLYTFYEGQLYMCSVSSENLQSRSKAKHNTKCFGDSKLRQ